MEAAIRRLLVERSGTICPSEAARAVDPARWRERMEAARAAARRMAARGEVVVMQGGRRVDAAQARGPIRLARGPAFEGPPA